MSSSSASRSLADGVVCGVSHARLAALARIGGHRRRAAATLLALPLAASACTHELVRDLDDRDAARAMRTLESAGIAVVRVDVEGAPGRHRLDVSADDVVLAAEILDADGLPRSHPAAANEEAAYPTVAGARRAELVARARSLEATLEAIDGVVSARVELDARALDPLTRALAIAPERAQATASVVLRHRGVRPPIESETLRALVAASCVELRPDDVRVVTLPVPPASVDRGRALALLGPFVVAQRSLGPIRSVLVALVALVGALGAAVAALALRARRASSDDSASKKPADSASVRA